MHICVIGTGFVGVVSSGVFSSFGHTVVGLDVDERKIDQLRQGIVPFYEPSLTDLLIAEQQKDHLTFTTSYEEAISQSEVIIIAVGTPSAADGQADLKYIFAACESLAPYLQPKSIVAIKSTVPPGTLPKAQELISRTYLAAHPQGPALELGMASLPEFLKEGSAVADSLHPDRVVIGAREDWVFQKLSELHTPLQAPIIKVSPESAQMAKYAANSYLATRITFINQIADLCELNGADVQEVISAISPDKRIGTHYWYPGLGYGGSCFPKDVKELAAYSRSVGEANNLFNKVNELNEDRMTKLMDTFDKEIGGWKGKKVALLGLSFKPNTNDTREAPSTKIVPYLLAHQARVAGYDPKARLELTDQTDSASEFVQKNTLAEAVIGADVIMCVVEWPEITDWDFGRSKESKPQFFIDARNQFDQTKLVSQGYQYLRIGKKLHT